jgi:nitrogen fixation protein NifU and related proteins
MYSEELLDHFQRPRNAGELPNATSRVEVTNPACGDVLQLAVRVANGVIREARFLCRGCTASIACASLLTEKMQGKTAAELQNIHRDQIAAELGGLPPASVHAAQLAQDGLQAVLKAMEEADS